MAGVFGRKLILKEGNGSGAGAVIQHCVTLTNKTLMISPREILTPSPVIIRTNCKNCGAPANGTSASCAYCSSNYGR